MASENVLSQLVAEVLKEREEKKLSQEDQRKFYIRFESEISQQVEEMRADRRKVYDDIRDIALS